MGDLASRFVGIARELYRRRVPRVATAYLIAGWAVVTFSQDLSEFLELPVWAPKLILALLILGFPVTIAVSWAFDLTSHGVVRTPAEHDLAPRHVPGPGYRRPIGAAFIIATVLFLAMWNIWRPGWGDGSGAPGGRVAVMPAVVPATAEIPDPGRLEREVASLIAARLEGMGWEIVDDDTVFLAGVISAVSDPRTQATRVARRVNAKSFVEIRFAFEDGSTTLMASLYGTDKPEERIAHGEATGSFDNILPLVDQVTAQLAGLTVPISQQRIAIMPALIVGADTLEWLSEAVATLLSSKLEMVGWPTIDNRSLAGSLLTQRATSLQLATSASADEPSLSDGSVQPPELDNASAARIAEIFSAGLFVKPRVEVLDEAVGSIRQRGRGPGVHVAFDLYRISSPDASALGGELEGSLGDLPELIDAIAHELMEWADNETARATDITEVPTRSMRALAAFTAGDRAFRQGDIRGARDAFYDAVVEDSGFALAYYRLSVAAEWLGNNADPWKSRGLERALANRARLPWRHRLLVEARDIWKRTGETDRTEQLYKWIIADWDEDYEAWFQLAEWLTHEAPLQGRTALEASNHWQKLMGYDNLDFTVLMHHARVLALEGKQRELENTAQQALEMAPSVEREIEVKATLAFGLDDPAGRQLILDDLTARDDPRLIWSVASRVAIYNRSLPGAERIARLLIDPSQRDSIRVLGHVTLAHLLLAQGRWREARAQIGQVREIDPLTALIYTVALSTTGIVPELTNSEKIRIRDELLAIEVPAPTGQPATELTVHDSIHDRLRLYALGNIHLALGSVRDSRQISALLQNLPGSVDAKRIGRSFAQSLDAMVMQQTGAGDEAAEQWEAFRVEAGSDKIWLSPFFALSRERFIRALTLQEAGKDEEALAMYSSFGEVSIYDLAYMAPALFHRAEILEARGEHGSARADYERFIDLWRNADPELQRMVEQARARVGARALVTE